MTQPPQSYFVLVPAASKVDAEAIARLANHTVPFALKEFKAYSKKDLIELSAPYLKDDMIKAQAFENLRACMGYTQNGSQTKVSMSEDDAITLPEEKMTLTVGVNCYHGRDLNHCIEQAVEAGETLKAE